MNNKTELKVWCEMLNKDFLFIVLMLISQSMFAQATIESLQPAHSVSALSTASDISIHWTLPQQTLSGQRRIRQIEIYREDHNLPMSWPKTKSTNKNNKVFKQHSKVNIGVKLATLNSGQVTYRDKRVEPGKRYYYRVVLIDARSNASQPSLPAIATLKDNIAPLAVVLNEAKAIDTATLSLYWQKSQSSDVDVYRIYRKRNKSNSKLIKINSLNDKSKSLLDAIVWQKPNAQITYHYAVSAVDISGNESDLSNWVTLRLADNRAPQSPLQLSLKQVGELIEINWLPNQEDDLAGYRIYRKKGNDPFRLLKMNLIENTKLIDSEIQSFTQFRYRVAAVDRYGNESKATKGVLIRTTGFDVAMLAPQNLKVGSNQKNLPLLKWQLKQPVGVKLAAVIIQRSDGEGFSEISTISPQINFTDTSVVAGRAYQYRIQALSANGDLSAISNTVSWRGGKQ